MKLESEQCGLVIITGKAHQFTTDNYVDSKKEMDKRYFLLSKNSFHYKKLAYIVKCFFKTHKLLQL